MNLVRTSNGFVNPEAITVVDHNKYRGKGRPRGMDYKLTVIGNEKRTKTVVTKKIKSSVKPYSFKDWTLFDYIFTFALLTSMSSALVFHIVSEITY